MTKTITFNCDSGGYYDSCRSQTFDISDLGYCEDEWEKLTNDEKMAKAESWAEEQLKIWYEE